MRMRTMIAALALLTFTGSAEARTRPATSPVYSNPVLDADFPDPTVIRAPDGCFFVFGL